MGLARRVIARTRDKDGSLAAVFRQAASDLGRLLAQSDSGDAIEPLVASVTEAPAQWAEWLPTLLSEATPEFAQMALRDLGMQSGVVRGGTLLIRQLADKAGDPDSYQASFTPKQLLDPSIAAEVAQRMLTADRVSDAVALLEAAQASRGRLSEPPNDDWEAAWIEALDRSGRGGEAQAARWASFERTLSASRARDFTRRLADFDDVEAESRAFAHAAAHTDFERAFRFLMEWPALGEAARMIAARPNDIAVTDTDAELWAEKLRFRHPAAASMLLRKAAAAAFRRRDVKTCDRLTAEADAIDDAR
jgi:hypothetical protein